MDVLVAVVDLHPVHWGKRSAAAAAASSAQAQPNASGDGFAGPVLTLTSFVDQLLVFFNSFLILTKANQLCVIGVDGTHADFLWPLSMAQASQQHQQLVAQEVEQQTQEQQVGSADMDTGDGTQPAGKGRRKSHKAASGTGAAAAAAANVASASDAAAAPAYASTLDASGIGVNDELLRQMHAFAQRGNGAGAGDASSAAGEGGSKIAGALSLALCYLNRVHTTAAANPSGVKLRSRLLVFSMCADESSQYVSVMNAIFSAQKQSIPVDSCVLSASDSLFLQQASHLTKGIYGRVPVQHQHALLQYLMFMYLSDATSRAHLILPTQSQVDLRATCFCHQQVVQLAVICPVCLAIFCKSQPKCEVCKTRFAVLIQPGAGGPRTMVARPTTPQMQQAPTPAGTAAGAATPAR